VRIVRQDQQTALWSAWIDRALRIVAGLLVVVSLGFATFYYWDRYHHSDEPLVEHQTRHLEEMVRQNPANPDLRVAVGRWYLEQALVEQAIQQGQEALKLSPDHQDALILLGYAYLAKGEAEQAIAHFARVVELNKDNEFAAINPQLEAVYYELGDLYLKQGDLQRAEEAFQAALKIDRTDADAHYGLALAYQRGGDHAGAIAEFREATRYVPDFVEAYEGMGTSYRALGQMVEATYADGMVSYARGRYGEAVEVLRQVVEQDPSFADVYLGLGLVYEKLGRRQDSIAALQRYLDVYPDDMAARYALARVTRSEAP